jgi:meiotically up-regulated gene 157 (Mug157) protein
MRSHRPDGTVKDAVFQADQQLYPLLELCDYVDATGELPRAPRAADAASWWAARVGALWAALPVRDGLVPTAENPADDSAELPYPLSSQVLLWAAATRLATLRVKHALDVDPELETVARAARAAVRERFATDGPFGRQWAYETDAAGRDRLYHDANDLPTALAPLLGFCAPDDAAWVATMRFAFSPHNPAFRPGAYGGLGSLHTPGTWTLGDVQEWVVAGITGDGARAERALARLLDIASDDGMLPEAYDPDTGGAPIRPWFAWPGAALGWLLLRHGRGPA